LKFYNVDFAGNIIVFTGESSNRTYLRDLDVCVFCDPSMGESEKADETGIMVTGIDHKNNIFILETIKKRLRPPELIEELYRLNIKYRPRLIAIEEVNFSGIYRYWIENKSKDTDSHLPIRQYKPGTKRSKEGRIRGLAHFFSAGQVYVHEGMHDFQDEYEQFPMGKSQHLLDALAQGPEFWARGVDKETVERQKKDIEEVLVERSILTGY
jgi:predicted phage terminase large subunit-like protein